MRRHTSWHSWHVLAASAAIAVPIAACTQNPRPNAPPAPVCTSPVTVGKWDTEPRLANPDDLRRLLEDARLERFISDGAHRTTLLVWVTEEGSVGSVCLGQSSGSPQLDAEFAAIARVQEFEPGIKAGKSAAGWISQPFNFSVGAP